MVQTKRQARQSISTRVDREVYRAIERLAERRRTTPGHVARLLLEDAAREVAARELGHEVGRMIRSPLLAGLVLRVLAGGR